MDLACSDCSARGMASDWLLSLLLGTAVYGSVRTVVWKDGMGSNPMPPIRFLVLLSPTPSVPSRTAARAAFALRASLMQASCTPGALPVKDLSISAPSMPLSSFTRPHARRRTLRSLTPSSDDAAGARMILRGRQRRAGAASRYEKGRKTIGPRGLFRAKSRAEDGRWRVKNASNKCKRARTI